jgi:sigma-E factor negative regulatory protein RseA
MKEQLSALIDGEANDLERERTWRALHADSELRGAWERYHLMRTAVRRELDVVVGPDVVTRVRERLEQEHPGNALHRFLTPRMLKLSAGVAIAASVATVAILNLSPVVIPSSLTASRSTPTSTPVRTSVAEARPAAPEQQRILNPYLVHHAEFSSTSSVNSMSAYARVVGRDNAPVEPNSAE